MFTSRLVSVVQVAPALWETTTPIRYGPWTVPPRYRTDFASVPRLAWSLVPRFGAYTAATVLHDWLITDALDRGAASSREVDRTFRQAMAELGVSIPRRWLMWAGVRWGALANPARRAGFVRDLPAVLGVSALALPLLVPAVAVLPSLLVLALLDRIGDTPPAT